MKQDELIEMWRKAWPDNGSFVRASAQDLEAFAKLAFEKGFFAGFEASGEGFNGEYPYGDKGIDITKDEYVLHALKEARGEA